MINTSLLIERLQQRAQGKLPDMRSVLVIADGAMRGAYGAGALLAFDALGLSRVFDIVIGISTGAPSAAYFLAGPKQTVIGASVYYQECTQGFLSWKRPLRPFNFRFLADTFRTGPKALDIQAIHRQPSKFYVVATNPKTGASEFIDAKTAQPNLLEAILASIAIPGHTSPVTINGQLYIDGGLQPLPMKDILDRFRPTDVCVLPNRRASYYRRRLSYLGDLALALGTVPYGNWWLARRTLRRKRLFAAGLDTLARHPDVHGGVFWPPERPIVSSVTNNPTKIRLACEVSAKLVLQQFGQTDKELSFL